MNCLQLLPPCRQNGSQNVGSPQLEHKTSTLTLDANHKLQVAPCFATLLAHLLCSKTPNNTHISQLPQLPLLKLKRKHFPTARAYLWLITSPQNTSINNTIVQTHAKQFKYTNPYLRMLHLLHQNTI